VNPPKADPSALAARGDHWPIFVLSLEGDEARRAPLLTYPIKCEWSSLLFPRARGDRGARISKKNIHVDILA